MSDYDFSYEEPEPQLRFCRGVFAAVKFLLKTAKAQPIHRGEINRRSSRAIGETYQSFGCPRCGTIVGNHYYFDEVSFAYYAESVTKIYFETQVPVTELPLAEYGEDYDYGTNRWCYPESGEFCT